jgi:two-component system NtrC family sensor kinase
MSNLNSLQKYVQKIKEFTNLTLEGIEQLPREGSNPGVLRELLQEQRKSLKIDFISSDIVGLINESIAGTERVKTIVQDLKTFARIEESGAAVSDINKGLESTINIVWNELKYKTVVRKEFGEIPPTRCNMGHLNQVFMNLLVNAAQAIEHQGEIDIRTWRDDGHICISVSDTGCGIPKEQQHRIFDPFFTTKPVGKGTGLGLSIAYDIVKKHNGSIDFKSEVGRGSTFTIRIPIVGE